MKKVIFLCSVLFLFASCQEKQADNQLRILIRNNTDSLMTVVLYPKPEKLTIGRYIYSDINQIYKDTVFIPDDRLGTELYITADTDMEPHLLATRIFDSINVRMSSGKILRFSPRGAVNYSRNLFTDKSAWIYEKNRFELVKMWREKYIDSDDYFFVISGSN